MGKSRLIALKRDKFYTVKIYSLTHWLKFRTYSSSRDPRNRPFYIRIWITNRRQKKPQTGIEKYPYPDQQARAFCFCWFWFDSESTTLQPSCWPALAESWGRWRGPPAAPGRHSSSGTQTSKTGERILKSVNNTVYTSTGTCKKLLNSLFSCYHCFKLC